MVFNQRRSGILLHPTSLPGKYGIGSLGKEAFKFVDWLLSCGQTIWQMLPLGPADGTHSPYQAYSAFAGNPDMIDIEWLLNEGLLEETDLPELPKFPAGKINFAILLPFREKILRSAFKTFELNGGFEKADYQHFWSQNWWWLESWSLFDACRKNLPGKNWSKWEEGLRLRQESALYNHYHLFREDVLFSRFLQFVFFSQWYALKKYANSNGVLIFGDIPLYVSYNSADVWSNSNLFLLDQKQQPTLVGGVPPDYFSATGQHWGNPLYNWEKMKEEGYRWWMARMHFNLQLFDIARIDHFRGLEAFWAIPAGEKTAINGSWMKAGGDEMLQLLSSQLGNLPIVAEDLGLISDEVYALRNKFGLPGMKVLQFAFSGEAENPHLPHNHAPNFLVYTGTHDNDTTVGWMKSLTTSDKRFIHKYLGQSRNDHWSMIRKALESVAVISILPFQDIAGLDATARMNIPGTAKGNWLWRMQENQIEPSTSAMLLDLTALYGRKLPS